MEALVFAYPPSANRYWRHSRGHMYVSDEAIAYKSDCVIEAIAQANWLEPVAGPVAVTVRLYRPRKSGDLDNRLKVLLDALQGIVYVNDSQIVQLHAYRFDDRRNPRVEVSIEEIGEA